MPDIERLRKTLRFLDAMYQQHQTSEDPEEAVAFAKLAVLEFCGWVEMTIDDIARGAVRVSLPAEADRKLLEDLIKGTHGFNYYSHVSPLLVSAIGSVRFSVIERTMEDETVLERFKGVLNSAEFLRMRNRAAHTFNDGTQRNYDAPSAVLGKLQQISPLMDRMRELCREEPNPAVAQ
jgi:2-iminobutanoate/2-iminopropanoate deaminase